MFSRLIQSRTMEIMSLFRTFFGPIRDQLLIYKHGYCQEAIQPFIQPSIHLSIMLSPFPCIHPYIHSVGPLHFSQSVSQWAEPISAACRGRDQTLWEEPFKVLQRGQTNPPRNQLGNLLLSPCHPLVRQHRHSAGLMSLGLLRCTKNIQIPMDIFKDILYQINYRESWACFLSSGSTMRVHSGK